MLKLGCGGLLVIASFGVAAATALAAEEGGLDGGRLKTVGKVVRDDLDGVVTAAVSPDGRFLYASSWKAAALVVFARDARTGLLDHRQSIVDRDLLDGTTAIGLSPDGRLAMAAAFRSQAVVLFRRDADSGELTRRDLAHDGEKEVALKFPIDVAFSLDSKFAYVLDDNGPNGKGSIVTFKVEGGKLALVGLDEGKDGCYHGARGLAFHPDGKSIFVAAADAGTLVAIDRDPTTGGTAVRQVIKDDDGDVHSLAGAMGVAISPDGRNLYVSAGRFSGDDAVSVFAIDGEGRIAFLQEFVNGKGDLQGFEGGNHLLISPDGRNVYAAATRLGSVACFRRDRETGRLTFLESIPDGGGNGDEAAEFGAAGLGISPDGRDLYVATEDKRAIAVFERTGVR